MEYSIPIQEVREFYKNQYAIKSNAGSFSFNKDNIEMDKLKMSVSEWKTSVLKAHLIEIKPSEDIELIGGIHGDLLILHFVCEGETKIEKNKKYPATINKNTNNFFCPANENVRHSLKGGQNNSYFKVILPFDYINTKVKQYPDIFGALSLMVENQCPILQKGNLITTLEMKIVTEVSLLIKC